MSESGDSHGLAAFRKMIEPWVRQLAGARISGEIPVPEARLNQWIGEWARRPTGRFESVVLKVRPGGQIDVRIVFRNASLVPPLNVQTQIVEQPRLPASPVFVLRWTLLGMGRLAALVGHALPFFTTPPPGIELTGDRIVVNVEQLARQHGGEDLFANVSALHVSTHSEMLLVTFALAIPTA